MSNAAMQKIGEMPHPARQGKSLTAARGILTGLTLAGPFWILAAMLVFSLTIRH